jgi:carboxypeptidase C (cathepsin A)
MAGSTEYAMKPWNPFPLTFGALLTCVSCAGASGRFSPGALSALPAPLEDAAVSRHQITLGGTALAYTATAGHLTASTPDGNTPEAAMFYVAYTADGRDPATRPVTFLYNGGPGSASLWLHLGSFGPKRLVTGDPATTGQVPFPLVDNPECLLETTDLVFVDAVGTGLSEAIAPNSNQTFWGVDPDAAVFRDFVRRYLAANQRQASPLYLFGESYGTPRSAVLANLLGAAGVPLAGVVLQSSILNYNTNGGMGAGVSCAGFLPTYAALGAYYQLDSPAPGDLPDFVQRMRRFTAGSYVPAVNAWLGAGTAPDPGLVAQLNQDTGISESLWQGELNLLPGDFQSNLLPEVLIGRYDGRVSAPVGSVLASQGDPSSTFISQPFADAISAYLDGFLGYGHGSDYQVMNNDANENWDFSHDGLALPDTIPDLAAAMARNPRLKVVSLNGYHDLATPFYQTELDLARMDAQPNLWIRHYAGGHMVYLDDASRPREKGDLVAFYQGAEGWAAPFEPAPDRAGMGAVPVAPGGFIPRTGRPLLIDPYVPPGKWHPAAGTETTGERLKAQVRRKLQAVPPE